MSYLFLRVERDGAELSFFILQPTQYSDLKVPYKYLSQEVFS